MNTRNKRHFTTALRVLTIGICLNGASAFAQNVTAVESQVCQSTYGVQPYAVSALEARNGWWFLPTHDGAMERYQQSTLPFVAARQHEFLSENDLLFVKLPKNPVVANESYVIVRTKRIEQGKYQPRLGELVQVIGRAKNNSNQAIVALDDSDGGVGSSAPNHKFQALVITKAFSEIQPSDRILPKSCIDTADNTSPNDTKPMTNHQTAHVVSLLNHRFIGDETSLILIDKGRVDGVQAGQSWQMLDVLAKDSHSAKVFGEASVQQVLETQSILSVKQTVHEVQVGDLLRIKETPAP